MTHATEPTETATLVCPACHGAIHVTPQDAGAGELACPDCGEARGLDDLDLDELFDRSEGSTSGGEAPRVQPPMVSEFPQRG